MKLAKLKKHVDALRGASKFRHGDPHTFAIPFLPLEVELPGASDPDAYLTKLRNKFGLDLTDKRCLVVGAGNGGLCAALMNLGAKEVVAAEDRDRFHGALDEVISLLGSLHEFNPLTYRSWPSTGCEGSLGQFDLIFFPESLEECRVPCETLETICRLLTSDGALFVEVQHGGQAVLKDPVNSFRPSEEAFEAMLKEITGHEPLGKIRGRAQNRFIYKTARTHQIGRAKAKPPAPLPTMPKEKKPSAPPPPPAPPAPKAAPKPKPAPKPEDEPVVIVPDEPEVSDKPVKKKRTTKKTTTKKSSTSGRSKKADSSES
jgi:hypothetical protein